MNGPIIVWFRAICLSLWEIAIFIKLDHVIWSVPWKFRIIWCPINNKYEVGRVFFPTEHSQIRESTRIITEITISHRKKWSLVQKSCEQSPLVHKTKAVSCILGSAYLVFSDSSSLRETYLWKITKFSNFAIEPTFCCFLVSSSRLSNIALRIRLSLNPISSLWLLSLS